MTYSPIHTNFVGYRGLVLLNNTLLLASSGDVTFAANPIKSTANWGAGSWNASDTVAWSANLPEIDANIECDVTAGAAIDEIEEFSKRYKISDGGTPLSIHPTNTWGFEGKAYCDSLTLKCQENQNLTASIKGKAYAASTPEGGDKAMVDNYDPNDPNINGVNRGTGDLGIKNAGWDTAGDKPLGDSSTISGYSQLQNLAYNALFPYWLQRIYFARVTSSSNQSQSSGIPRKKLSEFSSDDWTQNTNITDWSITINHNIQFKKTCGMANNLPAAAGGWPLAPDYVALGAMTGDCSLTFVGSLNEYNFNHFYHTRAFAVAFNSPVEDNAPNNNHIGIIPAMTCESYPLSLQTGNDIITANFSYNAVGNGTDAPVMLSAWNKDYPGIASIPTP